MVEKKYLLFIFAIVVLIFCSLLISALAGCCSRHDGVCGCQCCDGTDLSSNCADAYGCNNSSTTSSSSSTNCTPNAGEPYCLGKEIHQDFLLKDCSINDTIKEICYGECVNMSCRNCTEEVFLLKCETNYSSPNHDEYLYKYYKGEDCENHLIETSCSNGCDTQTNTCKEESIQDSHSNTLTPREKYFGTLGIIIVLVLIIYFNIIKKYSNSKSKKWKWIVSYILILFGIIGLASSIIGGLIFLIVGLFFFPPLNYKIISSFS